MTSVEGPAVGDAVFGDSSHGNLLRDVILKQCGKSDTTEKVTRVEDVVPAGDNYLGSLHRVFLEVSRDDQPAKKRTLIVKMLPKNEFVERFVLDSGVFQTEQTMYSRILPEMNRISADVLGESPFSAECLDTGEDSLLVMEDLRPAGYKMADRQVGLDLAHCRLAVETLARYHAVSAALQDQLLDSLPEKLFRADRLDGAGRLYRQRYLAVADAVVAWPGFERFSDKLRGAGETAAEKVFLLNDRHAPGLVVLNHGDFWVNNMLFRYSDGGEVADVRFVDFQLARRASPAIDLHYFLVTSPDDEVRRVAVDILLEAYHTELCRVLRVLGRGDKCASLDWLRQELKDTAFYALHVACTLLNIMVVEPDDAHDLSPLSNGSDLDDTFVNSYSGARYKQIMEKLLPWFEEQGVL